MKDKLKRIFNSNMIYRIAASIILLILGIGFIQTYKKPFITGTDLYWLRIFYVLIFILLVQILFMLLLGQVQRISKMVCSTSIINMIAMLSAFMLIFIYGFMVHFAGYPIDGYIHEMFICLLWPASIWASHSWISTIVFVLLATGISTPLQYFFLRKDTKNKKRLFASILISAIVCYSAISVFFNLNY